LLFSISEEYNMETFEAIVRRKVPNSLCYIVSLKAPEPLAALLKLESDGFEVNAVFPSRNRLLAIPPKNNSIVG
jgi:hypothetical protein